MKNICYTLFIALFMSSAASAQRLTAYFSYSVFNQPKGSPYIETYLSVMGNSVKFIPNGGGKLQSKIEIQWVLKKTNEVKEKSSSDSKLAVNDSQVVAFDKYNLLSPEINTETDAKPSFLDQKRILAPNGNYILELTIFDKNTTGSKFTIKEPVSINFPNDKVSFSDIELLESFTKTTAPSHISKSGFDLIPNQSNFYPQEMTSIKFYVELYNGKKVFGADDFILRYQIVNEGNKQIVNDLAGLKKMKGEEVTPIVMEIPLTHLYSGNYSLVLEARDKNNQVVAYKAAYFQRSNPIAMRKETLGGTGDYMLADVGNSFVTPINNKDSLRDFIACLYPISSQLDRRIEENLLDFGTVESMKKFMYYFWANQDSANPEQRWLDYKAEVAKVNYSYTCYNKRGYDSDQGRVYLQYGPPNSIEIGDNAPDTYPYEIWHYYALGDQRNRKFVFYSKFRAISCYSLLSSDARGETYLYDWNYRLHPGQQIGTYGLDADDAQKNPYNVFGDKTRSNYDNPH